MENTVKIPQFLYEIHGKQSNWFDIITTHLLALLTVVVIQYLTIDLGLPSWKKWILIGLAYGLGSGLVTHFSYSTKLYYQNTKRKIIFLSMHFLYPLFMVWVFPEHLVSIAVFSGIVIFSAFIINAIENFKKQLPIGVFLSLTGMIALQSTLVDLNIPLQLLLTLFLLKLCFSFTINWHVFKEIEIETHFITNKGQVK